MKNALLNAASYMAVPFGVRINAFKLAERTGLDQKKLIEAIKPYAAPAVDMYEIGEAVAMGDANDPCAGFGLFGEWFGNYMREESKVPEDTAALKALSDCIFACFTGQLTNQQDSILRARLDAELREYANE